MNSRPAKAMLSGCLLALCFSGCSGAKKLSEADVQLATPAKTSAPRYPARAAANGVEGGVCFSFTILANGSVSDLKIYDSKPAGVFDEEATRAISKWRFKPRMVDGKAIDQPDAKYCIDFKLG